MAPAVLPIIESTMSVTQPVWASMVGSSKQEQVSQHWGTASARPHFPVGDLPADALPTRPNEAHSAAPWRAFWG